MPLTSTATCSHTTLVGRDLNFERSFVVLLGSFSEFWQNLQPFEGPIGPLLAPIDGTAKCLTLARCLESDICSWKSQLEMFGHNHHHHHPPPAPVQGGGYAASAPSVPWVMHTPLCAPKTGQCFAV